MTASDPTQEWCPPGHGDLYAALYGSGTLATLLQKGYKYLFVSNIDNLGATLDVQILTHFVQSNTSFLVECCERTLSDRKGGHIAIRKNDQQLILRESAMCVPQDEPYFQDVTKHRFFNTNNLWVRLDRLQETMDDCGGILPLPMIRNLKNMDPSNENSPKFLQLETAMGAAIECFKGATAMVVPRARFAPVKKCNDLLVLRSDAYTINKKFLPVLHPDCNGIAPVITLVGKEYHTLATLEELTKGGIPSLVQCQSLTLKGPFRMTKRTTLIGHVSILNDSSEAKILPSGRISNVTLDLTEALGLGPLRSFVIPSTPFAGQKPGTSGLRKKTKVFMQPQYLNNFIQCTLDAVKTSGTNISKGSLVIGGDGRYFNQEAIQCILQMAIANGVTRFWIGKDGLLSTPATSSIVRERGPLWQSAFGAFILTASHNPGGPDEDFGIKYNCQHGEPAQETLTNVIHAMTTSITHYNTCLDFPTMNLSSVGSTTIDSPDGSSQVVVEVINSTQTYVSLMQTIFDFDAIQRLLDRDDFTMVYDAMHGVNGPYAKAIFLQELNQPKSTCLNCIPKEDFNGGHADPNLIYAHELVATMGLDTHGHKIPVTHNIPSFGAAGDGDGDRNMILGSQFFVTPSDSLAILVSHSNCIPFVILQGKLKGVARSMPTSRAVDRVANALRIDMLEVPTGWKYFGNLMDSNELYNGKEYTPFFCGEESFGTGSNHIREKDGLWAVLAWLQILASVNADASKSLVSVEDLVTHHWQTYGRHYYCRWDFENMESSGACAMMTQMRKDMTSNTGRIYGTYTIVTVDEFTYVDPVDLTIAKNQGIRFFMEDGSRIVFRLSGTAGSGATVRMYIEQYTTNTGVLDRSVSDALQDLVDVALQLCDIKTFCGTNTPTVIT